MAFTKKLRKADLFGYFALLYAASVLFFCGLVPDWGQWYSSSSYHREQSKALLHGRFAISNNPRDLSTDLCWSGGGVQQVWGLGISLWRLPFDALSELLGEPAFPDRLGLGLFMALGAYVVFVTWLDLGDKSQKASTSKSPNRWAGYGAVILCLVFAPLINLLRSKMDHYYEVMAYLAFFGILLMCGTVSLARNPTWKKFWGLSTLSGFGGLIRPTLVFYAFATVGIGVLIMFHYEREQRKFNLLDYSWTIVSRKLLTAAVLFSLGGIILFASNYLRFGNGFEFGHKLNVSQMLPSIYATRFDYPFKHLPLIESGRELFGALFQIDQFNGIDFYKSGIFSGQSSTIRARKFNYTTYDLSYAAVLFVSWLVGIRAALKWLWSSRRLPRETKNTPESLSTPWVLIVWSILSSLPLIGFYMKTHAIGDRYMWDFVPAFSAALIGLWLFVFDTVVVKAPSRKSRQMMLLCLSLILASWQAYEIISAKQGWGPSHSVTLEELAWQSPKRPLVSSPNEYRTRKSLDALGIPFNGLGWETNGIVRCCGIFYVDSPRFLELELTLSQGYTTEDAPLNEMKAKIGLEKLNQLSIHHTNDSWIVEFSGPKQERYQKGLQPAFVAFVPSVNLGKFVQTPSPWILKRIAWRK
jgi:hypothetical protein